MLDVHSHTQFGAEVIRNLSPEMYADFRKSYPNQKVSIGVHPWNIDESWSENVNLLSSQLSDEFVVALGETGLDKKCKVDFSLQQAVFEQHIHLSEKFFKPIIIHCVGAYNEIFSYRKRFSPTQKWVLHGFRGNSILAQQILDNGLLLSIGYYFNSETVKILPEGFFFIETDESCFPIETIAERISKERALPATFIL